jgi:hypothetical protein
MNTTANLPQRRTANFLGDVMITARAFGFGTEHAWLLCNTALHMQAYAPLRPPVDDLAAQLERTFGGELGRGADALRNFNSYPGTADRTLLCCMGFTSVIRRADVHVSEKVTKAWLVLTGAPARFDGRAQPIAKLLPAMVVLGHAWQAAHGGTNHCDPAFSSARPIITAGGVTDFIIQMLEHCGWSFTGAEVVARCWLLAIAFGWGLPA